MTGLDSQVFRQDRDDRPDAALVLWLVLGVLGGGGTGDRFALLDHAFRLQFDGMMATA